MHTLRLRELRKQHGMTQRELAQAMNLSVSAISQFERGEIEISLSALMRLAEALGCMPCELYPPLSRFQLEGEEFEMIKMLRNLTPDDRQFIQKHLHHLHQSRT